MSASPDLLKVFDFLDTKTGLMYFGDSEEFYLEILSVCIHSMPLSLPKKVSHHIFCDVRLFIGVFYCVNVSSPA